jgi:hypothetical protein
MDRDQRHNLLSYFRACYQADNRALQITNFTSRQIEKTIWLESAQLLTGELLQFPVATEWGTDVFKHLLLHKKEEELILGTFFLVGRSRYGFNKNQAQKVCAPLLQIQVDLFEEDEVYYLSVKEDGVQLNPAAIRFLEVAHYPDTSDDQFTHTYDQLAAQCPDAFLDFDARFHLEKAFKKRYPEQNFAAFHALDELTDQKGLNRQYRKQLKENEFVICAAAGLGLSKKSSAAQGVLAELGEMSQQENWSAPLAALFSDDPVETTATEPSLLFSPANLSRPQRQILRSAQKYPLTQVIGPPGTGKSFTIATLTIDALCRGQSALVVSKYDQAVDVITQKIKKDLGLSRVVARSGRGRSQKKQLRDKIQAALHNLSYDYVNKFTVQELLFKIRSAQKRIDRLEAMLIEREKNEVIDSAFLLNYRGGLAQVIKRYFIERKIKHTLPYWDLLEKWEKQMQRKGRLIGQYAKLRFNFDLQRALNRHRATFVALSEELKQKPRHQKSNFTAVANYHLLFKALPIWLTTTRETGQLLPLQAELFDLVIIDEASQCDIASALPALYRGKRAVIVGDPKQLRHLSFVSYQRQQQLQAKYQLSALPLPLINYRENSILDIANQRIPSQDQVHFLNEHYRSQPDIIHFSNRAFYQDALHIMTDLPTTQARDNITLHVCQGERNAQGVNEEEGKQLLAILMETIQEQSGREKPVSIGILSPFRAQVDYLKKQISGQLDPGQIERHQLLIGTPYHFQGEERDLMLLSMAVDDQTHNATFRYLDRADVFNVSITRAKQAQHIFISGDTSQWNNDLLLVQYMETIRQSPTLSKAASPLSIAAPDDFALEVDEYLNSIGISHIRHQSEVAGFPIDLLIEYQDKKFGIDLVGYPGESTSAFTPDRHRMLQRIGIGTFVLPYTKWIIEPEVCQLELQAFLKTS